MMMTSATLASGSAAVLGHERRDVESGGPVRDFAVFATEADRPDRGVDALRGKVASRHRASKRVQARGEWRVRRRGEEKERGG